MKTTLKRVLSIALAMVLLIGALPLQTFAEDEVMPIIEGAEPAHQHTYDQKCAIEKFLKSPAGCESDAVYYQSCSCGAHEESDGLTFTLEHSATGHSWAQDPNDPSKHLCTVCKVNGAHEGGIATCHEKGRCTVCGKKYGDKYDPNNHTGGTEIRDAVAATCTAKGYSGNTYCLGCDTVIEIGHETPVTPHTAVAGAQWKKNDTHHWKDCACGGQAELAEHNWKAVAESTTKYTCVCGAEKTTTINESSGGNNNGGNNEGANNESAVLTYSFYVNNSSTAAKTGTVTNAQNVNELIASYYNDSNLELHYATVDGRSIGATETINVGKNVLIFLKTKQTGTYKVYYNVNVDETSKENKLLREYPEGTPMSTILSHLALENIKFPGLFQDWFYIEGWYLPNGAKADANDVNWGLHENIVLTAKWKQKYNYEVVLKLYTNGNTNTVVKVIDAFKYVQDDGKLSHTEVTNIANEYIKSNNDAPLTIYGPFDASGWEQYSLYPNRLTGTEYITVNPYGTTVVHAMVHNAKINGSTNNNNKKADSSNPKTGDMIMMPAAVMGVSVSALAVMFYLKKKRTY